MPVPMRTTFHKAEAKYNVTTEFPSLGLHSAAATGNVGLVEYALNNGQPINSVLDGVLPLHAACAGGNIQVVKVLIDHGADVNAPRLPRKYSNDKNRDASAPIVGTSGSTPLHFAAANGNTEVVSLLLLHGAHADRADKHGVTPEMLAQQNGWVECGRVLREWTMNKDRDLREREGFGVKGGSSSGANGQVHSETQSSPSPRRRLHVKQSIDTALNMLKIPDSNSKAAQSMHTSTPPASPLKPFGEYTFYPVGPSNNSPIEPSSRRPSLPHILQPPSDDAPRNRQPPTSTSDSLRQRRPRSAGTGADRSPDQEPSCPVYGRGGSGRKLGSKYSLLNIFKKAQSGEGTDSTVNLSETGSTVDIVGGSLGGTPGSTVAPSLNTAPSHSSQASNIDLAQPSSLASAPARLSSKHRGSDASTKGSRFASPNQSQMPPLPRKPSGNLQTPPRINAPLALEMHLALAQQQQQRPQPNTPTYIDLDDSDKVKPSSPLAKFNTATVPGHNRNRSASSTSMPVESKTLEDDGIASPSSFNPDNEVGKPSPNPRPGILRAHNRTPSSGQGGSPINLRTLRFDSSSSNPSSERKARDSPRSVPPPLRSYNSAGSLTKLNIQTPSDNHYASPISEIGIETAPSHDDIFPEEDGDQDENYGQPVVNGPLVGSPSLPSLLLQRQRGLSFASSSESSLSPILSNDNVSDPTSSVLNADFPFSINRPPSPLLNDEVTDDLPASPDHLNIPVSSDSRNRGDSLSSNSTFDSRGILPMSSSNTSGSGASVTVASPGLSDSMMLPFDPYRRDPTISAELSPDGTKLKHVPPPLPLNNSGFHERRTHTPLDIDLTSISSHAQAEALVQRARQDVLDLANAQEASPLPGSLGRTPLSARLAAYGESLALEKKLREQTEEESYWKDRVHDPMPIQLSPSVTKTLSPDGSLPRQKSRDGVERQLSLENKASSPRYKKRAKDPRRPSTADGPSYTTRPDTFFAQRTSSHQSSHSTSTSNHPSIPLKDDTAGQFQSPMTEYIPIEQSDNGQAFLQGDARARAPIIIQPDDTLSRINSVDGADTETDSTPTMHRGASPPAASQRGKREQVRSAKKLTKMGIPVADQAAAASRASPVPPTPPTAKRFGIKSIMQTFKGKA